GGVAAAIKVQAVAVGVEGDVVNRQVVAAGDENGKMAAVKNRDVADQNISAQLEGDGFVADAHGRIGFGIRRGKMFVTAHLVEDFGIPLQPAAVDHAVAGDENIGEVFAPDEAVVKITMSAILVGDARKRLGFVVGVQFLRCAKNCRAGVNQQMNVAFQVN